MRFSGFHLVPLILSFFLPIVVFAQGDLLDVIAVFQSIIGAVVPFLVALAVFAVLFGLVKYAFRAGDEKAQEEGRRIMFWGIITLFVMVSVWGFVTILQNLFFGSGYNPSTPPNIPTLPTGPGTIPGGQGG